MKRVTFPLVAVAGIAFASIVSTTGCGSVDGANAVEAVTDEASAARNDGLGFHRHHRRPGGGGGTTGGATGGSPGNTATGGSTGTGSKGAGGTSVAGCGVCEKANTCCLAVNGGALCTYSVSTCESVAPAARDPYINGCLTLLSQAVSAHQAARAIPPAACL